MPVGLRHCKAIVFHPGFIVRVMNWSNLRESRMNIFLRSRKHVNFDFLFLSRGLLGVDINFRGSLAEWRGIYCRRDLGFGVLWFADYDDVFLGLLS